MACILQRGSSEAPAGLQRGFCNRVVGPGWPRGRFRVRFRWTQHAFMPRRMLAAAAISDSSFEFEGGIIVPSRSVNGPNDYFAKNMRGVYVSFGTNRAEAYAAAVANKLALCRVNGKPLDFHEQVRLGGGRNRLCGQAATKGGEVVLSLLDGPTTHAFLPSPSDDPPPQLESRIGSEKPLEPVLQPSDADLLRDGLVGPEERLIADAPKNSQVSRARSGVRKTRNRYRPLRDFRIIYRDAHTWKRPLRSRVSTL